MGDLTFGQAIEYLQQHPTHRVARFGWNGRDMWIALQPPAAHSMMTAPYLYMRTAAGELVPWIASQSDMLASDWYPVFLTQDVIAATSTD